MIRIIWPRDLNGDHLLDVVSSNAQDGTLAVFFNNAQSPAPSTRHWC